MKRLINILALALTVASCGTDSGVMQGTDDLYVGGQRCEIRLSGEIGEHADTRAAIGNPTYIQSNGIVYAWAEDTSKSSDHVTVWTLTANGSGGFTGATKYFPMTGSSLKARAFTGNFTATPTSWTTYQHQVVADQKTVSRVSDLLYGVSEAVEPSGTFTTFPIKFRHMLAKARVALCPSSGDVDDLDGAILRVVDGGGTIVFIPARDATPATMTQLSKRQAMLGTQSLVHDVHLAPTVVANFSSEPEAYGEAVVIPRSYSGTPLFRLFTPDGLTELLFTPESFELQSGMEYTFKIKVFNNQMQVECTIAPWDTGSTTQDATKVARPVDGGIDSGVTDWGGEAVASVYENVTIPRSVKLNGWTSSNTLSGLYSPVTSVSLNHSSMTLFTGKTASLVANVQPSYATDRSVTWVSSNSSVATVDNGMVRAVSAGSATITVTTADGGKTATCEVTVN